MFHKTEKIFVVGFVKKWLRGADSNRRPPGYEPGEMPLLYPAIPVFHTLLFFPKEHTRRYHGDCLFVYLFMDIFSLADEIIHKATQQKKTISTAESITGGRIASAFTLVSGASAVFIGGVVAYSEHSKIHSAGVPVEEIRKTHGYSEETAKYMAERVRRRNISDIGISTTGCAGPVEVFGFKKGEVVFGLSVRGKETEIFREIFLGTREEVQEKATKFALQKILEELH